MKKGYLQFLNGLFQGQRYGFFRSATLGRGKQNALQLMDPLVSRAHVKIEASDNGFQIEDLKSKNGTFLNGKQVHIQLLSAGDRIRIGETDFLFSIREISILEGSIPYAKIESKKKVITSEGSDLDEAHLSDQNITETWNRFRTILRVNRTIASEFDMKKAFQKVLEEIFAILPADRGAILSINEDQGKLEILCSRTRDETIKVKDILISQTILGEVMEESLGLLIGDAQMDERFSQAESISIEDIRSALCVPLIQKNETIGIIYLDVSGLKEAFTEDDLDLLMAIAGPASIQIQNALYVTQLKQSYWETIQALANAIEARDSYTIGHNWRVSRFAMAIASSLGWSEEEIYIVKQGGILHDIGKIGVSDSILLKDGNLEEDEFRAMKRHPEIGAKMISGIKFLRPVMPYVLHHHELWDGNGYPYGLKQEDIPFESRLLAVCDAFDAMTTDRPYRKGLDPEVALKELTRYRKIQFDPNVVDAFLQAWKTGKISEILAETQKVHSLKDGETLVFQSATFLDME